MNRIDDPSYVVMMTERVKYDCGTYETMDSAQEALKKHKQANVNPFKTYEIEKEWSDDE